MTPDPTTAAPAAPVVPRRVTPVTTLLRWLLRMVNETHDRSQAVRHTTAYRLARCQRSLRWLQGSKRPWVRFLRTYDQVYSELETVSGPSGHTLYWRGAWVGIARWVHPRWVLTDVQYPLSALQLYAVAEWLQNLPLPNVLAPEAAEADPAPTVAVSSPTRAEYGGPEPTTEWTPTHPALDHV